MFYIDRKMLWIEVWKRNWTENQKSFFSYDGMQPMCSEWRKKKNDWQKKELVFKLRKLLKDLNKLNIAGASMNQLGRSIYCFCKDSKINSVLDVLNTYKPEIQIFKLKVNKAKALKDI